MANWLNCKNILCIRADNMGDLLMSSPAIRALKETLNCKITLLTSSMGQVISPFIPEIDATIEADLPWIKTESPLDEEQFLHLIKKIKEFHFDAAVIFTVYSQNPLPAAMMAYMAGIPRRLAYCRENPYHLLTDWAIEREPYHFIQHQVLRDLNLVKTVGAVTKNKNLSIRFSPEAMKNALAKLSDAGMDIHKNWLILHPGVSEAKREFPKEKWIEAGKVLRDNLSFQLIITGSETEKALCEQIGRGIGQSTFYLAGKLLIEEFIALISASPLVISVNTGTVHIAAATHTPVIVLYALTNPQHTPWQTPSSVLYFSVKENLRSKNDIVNYVSENIMNKEFAIPSPQLILQEAEQLLKEVIVTNESD